MVNGKSTDDANVIANKFNEYFAQIGPNLAKMIPKNGPSFSEFLKGNYIQTFYVKPIQTEDGAPGIDCIPASVLKYAIDLIVLPLSHICQQSLNQSNNHTIIQRK